MIKSLNGTMVAAMLAAGLFASPALTTGAAAQSMQSAAPADAKSAGEAKPEAKPKAKSKKPPTPGQLAARARAKKCGAEWKADKAAGKIEKGMKWPKYWSACNKRLKAAGG